MSASQERTEAATPRRRAKARAKGLVARSAAAAPAFAVAAAAIPALALVANASAWIEMTVAGLRSGALAARNSDMSGLVHVAQLVLPQSHAERVIAQAWLAALVAALAASAACGALGFAPQAIVPRLDRALTAGGLRRLAFAENFWPAASAAASILLVASVTLPVALHGISSVANVPGAYLQANVTSRILAAMWWRAAAVLLVVAAVDVGVQRLRFSVRLKMTQREIRDERAETEAKPETKQRRRAVGARRTRGLRIAAIRKATAIITNPTHVAIALRYAPPEIDVPIIIARGADLMAAVVRAAAHLFEIPVIESAELARTLYAAVDIDEPIPEECFAAVAAIFAWIKRTRGVLLRGDEAAP